LISTKPVREARPEASAPVGIGSGPGGAAPALGKFARSKAVKAFETANAMLGALEARQIAAAVRGALPAEPVMRALAPRAMGELLERAVLLEPRPGQGVLFGPVGVAEGRGAASRTRFGLEAARTAEHLGLLTEAPLVAVLSLGRREDGARGRHIARSLAESAHVVARLQKAGLDAFSAGIQLEDVLADADIVMAPDGATGNLAFRALSLVGGVRSFGALVLGFPLPFVDTSRSRASFEDPLRLAAFLASRRRTP
jgi:predicted methyltransferase MtxX (methanogen marker protein 4)